MKKKYTVIIHIDYVSIKILSGKFNGTKSCLKIKGNSIHISFGISKTTHSILVY